MARSGIALRQIGRRRRLETAATRNRPLCSRSHDAASHALRLHPQRDRGLWSRRIYGQTKARARGGCGSQAASRGRIVAHSTGKLHTGCRGSAFKTGLPRCRLAGRNRARNCVDLLCECRRDSRPEFWPESTPDLGLLFLLRLLVPHGVQGAGEVSRAIRVAQLRRH